MSTKPHLCKSCGENNPQNFREGRKSRCKICTKQYEKEYRFKNSDKIKDNAKKWNEENPQRRKELYSRWIEKNSDRKKNANKIWKEKNKQHILDYRKDYEKKRKIEDPSFKAINNIRTRQWQVLNGKMSTTQNLGCSSTELKEYIESLFTEGMCWDNYGLGNEYWNIDHIKPLSKHKKNELGEWDEDSDFNKSLIHYTNLQPMWQKENREKSNKS